MSKQSVAQLEQVQQRHSVERVNSGNQLKKAELSDIVSAEMLVLATAIAQAVIGGLEMRERRKERRCLLLTVVALAALLGLARLTVRLMNQ